MKHTKLFTLMLALSLIFCSLSISVSATDEIHSDDIEIYIVNKDVSEETKEKIIAYYTNGGEDDGVAICGLTCTLFGHKLETTTIKTITHKVRATAPRCLQRYYDYEACTRCDYESSTLLSKSYIYCCS